ncbi:MAG: sugar phosphate isomerase/epimerase [Treponema sp.]|jgi:sugar phosphate isomerase/epimerase|nr:sugar phosphate isomerase/epimerase [Treponema sp.]
MTALTSVSFRSLGAETIIRLAKTAGLDGIEWGGDIHVPPGDRSLAANIKAKTLEAGLRVLSYGSYYKLLAGSDFTPVLETAAALAAPRIRVWAGALPSARADKAYYQSAAAELRSVCARAGEQGIRIGLEYHRATLTDTCESAEKLISLTNHKNLSTYWQPNPDLPPAEHHREITLLLPNISAIHVFHWKAGNIRRPLAEGEALWREYVRLLGKDRDYIMEFVMDDAEEQFLADAATLHRLLNPPRPHPR